MITVIRFFYILVTHNLIIPKKWLHSLNSEYATFFTVFYFVTATYLLDLSYGTPSARGAAEFFDVNANKINVATYGISL